MQDRPPITNSELFLLYKLDTTATLCEVCVLLSEDRPGILSAISNVFADHGINILSVNVNTIEKTIHFIVDVTHCMTPLEDVINKIKQFSFVNNVVYRVMRGSPLAIPSYIRPTFRKTAAVIIDKELLQQLGRDELAPISKIAYVMGVLDAKYIKTTTSVELMIEDLLELLKIVQLRGFCKVVGIEMTEHNVVTAVFSECVDEELVQNYVQGLVQELFRGKYSVKLERENVDSNVRIKLTFS